MKKNAQHLPYEPHIVKTFCNTDGRRIGAVADDCIVKTDEEAQEILSDIARLYGENTDRSCPRKSNE